MGNIDLTKKAKGEPRCLHKWWAVPVSYNTSGHVTCLSFYLNSKNQNQKEYQISQ
jgi:hypothetical protein